MLGAWLHVSDRDSATPVIGLQESDWAWSRKAPAMRHVPSNDNGQIETDEFRYV